MTSRNWRYVLCMAACIFCTSVQANPNNVVVELRADGSDPGNLTLYQDGQKIDIIDFNQDKKFIIFEFPAGYSNFDIKVFEQEEKIEKQSIMNSYMASKDSGINAFDELWPGESSSQAKSREFKIQKRAGFKLVIHNKNKDGTPEGVLHDYILKFTNGGTTYLLDPSIRNTRTN